MDCGWRKPEDDEITKTRAGKLTCAETAFAAELYKAGVIYVSFVFRFKNSANKHIQF